MRISYLNLFAMEDKSMIARAVDILKSRGFENIRADVGELERPSRLTKKGSDVEFTPDLTALLKDGQCYFEIVRNSKKDKSRLIDKWSLLATMARLKNGNFFLMTPHGKMNYAQKLIRENRIVAEIIKI